MFSSIATAHRQLLCEQYKGLLDGVQSIAIVLKSIYIICIPLTSWCSNFEMIPFIKLTSSFQTKDLFIHVINSISPAVNNGYCLCVMYILENIWMSLCICQHILFLLLLFSHCPFSLLLFLFPNALHSTHEYIPKHTP